MKLLIVFAVCLALAIANPVPQYGFLPKFALEVCLKDQANNVIVSPASVFTALGLAYLGAAGNTATEMQNVLHFEGKSKEQVAEFYAEFMKKFESSGFGKATDFKIANRIFVDEKYELEPKFNELATKYLQSSAEKVNFGQPQQTAEKINSWVAENTKNKIKNIISASSIGPEMATVLVNAIYFRAHWEHRFQTENTIKNDFFLTQTDKVSVDMMHKEEYYNYAEWDDLDATALQIPFVNTDIYMLVVLPRKVDGLKSLQDKMKTTDWKSHHDSFAEHKVKLSLPKFKFDYSISLNTVLAKLGLTSMFSNPDFSGLLTGGLSVPLSDVVHKAFIEVDEIGTEASAATMIAVPMSAVMHLGQPKIVEFNVDHPFMFAIKNRDTVFFSGHVNKF